MSKHNPRGNIFGKSSGIELEITDDLSSWLYSRQKGLKLQTPLLNFKQICKKSCPHRFSTRKEVVIQMLLDKGISPQTLSIDLSSLQTPGQAFNTYDLFCDLHDLKIQLLGHPIHYRIPKYLGAIAFGSSLAETTTLKILDQEHNLVYLTPLDHLIAHAILYIAGGQSDDFRDFFRVLCPSTNQTIEMARINSHIRGLAAAQAHKERGTSFYSSEVQKQIHQKQKEKGSSFYDTDHQKKMASKGGSVRSTLQKEVSKNNAIHLAKINLQTAAKNQTTEMKAVLKGAEWTCQGETYISKPEKTLKDLVAQLNKLNPNAHIKLQSNISTLVAGKAKSAYGWRLVKPLNNEE